MFGRFLAASPLVILAACQGTPQQPAVTVTDLVVTVPAVPGGPGAGYFTLRGAGGGGTLLAVASPRAERIELHETRSEGGMTRMVAIERVAVVDDEVRFEPGGKHAMLFGVDPALKVGDRLNLTFTFEGAPAVTVEADVRGPGQAHANH
ncbi:copper chaperone PCu(A)C [Sphingosinicella sp. YJ22]|uniref:copper chaperone PCu(A)C n=1 Tax=Sphingosinicella sp. YJ22 TaxID=1104780 RepID=UPI00140E81D2|nr:copper chaperone PCu(A)C [Sphingosinicella sp. YJ22]